MKTDLFQSCCHCWIFQIVWHIECSAFTASSFRIWNSSTGIPSHPLALFVLMLPKALLASHSRISGSRWVITRSWLSGSLRSFLYRSSVYSCHLFLISSVLYCAHLCMKCSLGISNFLEEISSLSHSIVLLYSLHWSLRKDFLSLLALLWNSAFKWVYLSFSPLPLASLLFSAIFMASSDNHFAFCISFSWGWFWTHPVVQCYEPPLMVLQALSIRSNPLNLFVTSTV